MTYVPWFLPPQLPSLFQVRPAGPRQQGGPDSRDARLACAVLERMQRNPALSRERICIEVQNCVVILDGAVRSAEVSAVAHATAWMTPGVHDVNNRLRQREP